MKILKRLLKFVAVLGVLGAIGAYLITYHVAPYAIIAKHHLTLEVDYNNQDFNATELPIITKDSLRLDGYLITPKTDSFKGIVILIHGIGSCKEAFLGLADKLQTNQIASYIFDLRAHGKSEGEHCTYGFHEKHDVQQLISLLKTKYPNKPIGVWGSSLGGAIAIQSLELDSRIDFGVIECTFNNLEQIVYDYQKRLLFGVGFRFMTNKALEIAGEKANFNPQEVNNVNSAKNIIQPIFIAHGSEDIHILPQYGIAIFENLQSQDKEFYLVKGADHNYLQQIGGDTYEKKVFSFIKRQL